MTIGSTEAGIGVPRFRNAAGAVGTNPLALIEGEPIRAVRLDRLATCFLPPILRRSFLPASPWHGLDRVWFEPEPLPVQPVEKIREHFSAAVRAAMGDAATVAVAVSGGMDSVAVLAVAASIAHAEGRRCVAVTVQRRLDSGASTSDSAIRLIRELGIDCEHRVVQPSGGALPWWCAGPRVDLDPHVECATNAAAHDAGADVLLSGEGADQVLAAGRFLTRVLLDGPSWRSALTYVMTARSRTGQSPGDELLGAVAARRHGHSSAAYGWLTWSRTRFASACEPLTPEYAQLADAWLQEFAAARSLAHDRADRTIACSWAVDAIACFNTFPPSGEVREAQPFLNAEFVCHAAAIPLAARFEPSLGPYLSTKSLVLTLLPPRARSLLPAHRETAFDAFSAFWAKQAIEADRLKDHGLIDTGWRPRRDAPFVTACVSAVDEWLRGAESGGARIIK